MSSETLVHIDLQAPINLIGTIESHAVRLPQEAFQFKDYLRSIYLGPGSAFEELYGGHRNLILRERNTDNVNIFWRSHETRWATIMRAILTEHVVSTKLNVPGRKLKNPNLPVEINENGHAVTKLTYIRGESRYPWTLTEIESSAALLHNLHEALRTVTFDPHQHIVTQEGDHQWVHGDFGRANTLFLHDTSTASAVIDYENLQFTSREQDIARTISILLVDTKLEHVDSKMYVPIRESDELSRAFSDRMEALLDTYPRNSMLNINEILAYTHSYLSMEDYGDLNHMSEFAMNFMESLTRNA